MVDSLLLPLCSSMKVSDPREQIHRVISYRILSPAIAGNGNWHRRTNNWSAGQQQNESRPPLEVWLMGIQISSNDTL